jgi:acyl-CoA thioesterase-1
MKKIILLTILISIIGLTVYSRLPKQEQKEIMSEQTAITQMDEISKKKIVAFGDSLTAGFRLLPWQAYPSILDKKLESMGYKYDVINKGISGETTTDAKRRINDVLEEKPHIVILEFGANDFFRRVPAKDIYDNLAYIIETFQKNNITVLLGGMQTLTPASTDYERELNTLYTRLASKYNLLLIPFFLEGVALNKELNLSDNLHPNVKGYEIIVEKNILPRLVQVLEK